MARNDGTYGLVYDKFWEDPEVLEEWSPSMRLFWLYLLTCPQRNIVGIFEFSERLASLHTGLEIADVQECIKTLTRLCKVSVSPDTREICVHNWLQYRGDNIWTNPNLIKGINNQAATIKNKTLLWKLVCAEKIVDAKHFPDKEIQKYNEETGGNKEDSTKTLDTVLQDSTKTDGTEMGKPLKPFKPYKPLKSSNTTAPAKADASVDLVPSQPDPDKELYQSIQQAFLAKNGNKFTNYPKEAQGTKGIIAKCKARNPTDPAGMAKAMIEKLWQLKSGSDKFYSSQPFLPSTLNASGIWDRVLEQYRDHSEQEEKAKDLVSSFYRREE